MYYQQQEAGAPQWREESYQPGDTYQEHAGRHARHQAHQQYEDEQYDGAYRQHEHAYRRPDPLTQPEEDCTHEESGAHGPDGDEGGRTRRKHNRELGARPGPASGRRLWLTPVSGLALGALLCALAFTWGSGQPPEDRPPLSAATNPPNPLGKPTTLTEMPPSSATPRNSSATPTATPTATPSVTPTATPSVMPTVTPSATPTVTPSVTPTQTQSADPVLLGPSNRTGVANMVQRYCDRYTGGSADPRNDGRWQCKRLLSASIVDMDVACRDTYDSGAYARASDPGDPYTWRCYR